MLFSLGAGVLLAAAQTLSPGEVRLSSSPYLIQPIIRFESQLVELEVVVRDSHGRAVTGLTKDDFTVYDSGKERELTAFAVALSGSPAQAAQTLASAPSRAQQAKALPEAPQRDSAASPANARWIALHFDDINTPVGDLAHARIAANRFVREAAGHDRIAVFTSSGGRTLDFTSDTSAVLASIASVQSHPRMSPGGLSSCPRISPYEAYQILNHNSTVMSVKIAESCRCGGADDTNTLCRNSEAIQPTELMDPTFNHGVGAGLIESIQSQAEQTWNLAHQISQLTLESIKVDLDVLARKSGSRLLLLTSSGFLSGTLDQEQDAIVNEAVRGGVVIDSIDGKGLYAEAPGGPINETNELRDIPVSSSLLQVESLGDRLDDLDSSMARFAESTGGLLFLNNNDLDLGFRQLGLLPSCSYLLGFTPAEDGKYHKIKVELKNAGHEFVQARPGYFAPTKGSSVQAAAASTDTIDAEMRGSAEKADAPATTTEKLEPGNAGKRQLVLQTRIDIRELPFEQRDDRHIEKLTFVAALFDPQGNFVEGKQAEMDLALKPENFERFSKSGISGVMQLEVPPGDYRLRMVVQEAVHGRMSAMSKELQIR
ncbi:MAG: VWA domain-containing protein [Candidatus Acidiferrum sp.]